MSYKVLSVREDVFQKLKMMAEKHGTSPNKLLSLLLEKSPVSLQVEANQSLCREAPEKLQNMVVSSVEAENEAQDKSGGGENGKCPFESCPFRDTKYGFVYQNKGQLPTKEGHITGKADNEKKKTEQGVGLILGIVEGLRDLKRCYG